MIRKKKQYSRPRKLFEKGRIEEENALRKEFGLKSKTEIWKALAKVNYLRNRAKALARETHEEQEVLFNKLRALGLKADSTADVLDLNVRDILRRRLPTIVHKNKIANTVKQARQLVVHKRILVNGKIVDSPSYLVPLSEEDSVTLKNKKAKSKKASSEEAQATSGESIEDENNSEEEINAEEELVSAAAS